MAIEAALGENGFELWDERSRSSDRYANVSRLSKKGPPNRWRAYCNVDFVQAFTVSATALLICSMPT